MRASSYDPTFWERGTKTLDMGGRNCYNDVMEIEKSSFYPDVSTVEAGRLVPIYLMSSYLYYEQDKNVLSDIDYDAVCLRLIAEWDCAEHPHRNLLNLDSLRAGTGYDVKYTKMIKMAALQWYDSWNSQVPLDMTP